ncbi:MAG TPA: hypothetical protein VJW95_01205 [Dissulfurispiraceae bacterium]|nr:hypothetical protein [Dissulfurispiraceae bacterium]
MMCRKKYQPSAVVPLGGMVLPLLVLPVVAADALPADRSGQHA